MSVSTLVHVALSDRFELLDKAIFGKLGSRPLVSQCAGSCCFVCSLINMAVHLNFLLILYGLTGIHSIPVSKVSVKAGDSISIPCPYGSQYRNHVKYLCKGSSWSSCSTMIRTDTKGSPSKFSISDDKIQRIFTVTIKDLTDKDTKYYWCAVEIDGGADVGERFYLLVTRETPSLYVDHQEITGFKGDNITINCHYSNPGEIKWCRVGSYCVTTSSGSIDGTRVTINASVPNVFTVTMSGLRTESSGWCWCGKGDFLMPVHITVTVRPTTFATTTITPTRVPVVGDRAHSSTDLRSLFIILGLLISIVIVTLFTWFLLKRHKRTKVESSTTTTAENEVTYSTVKHKEKTSGQAEEEVTYCNVDYRRKTTDQSSHTESGVDVMYSSVVIENNKL